MSVVGTIISLIHLLWCTEALRLGLQHSRSHVFPVFHNVLPEHVPQLVGLVQNRPQCSLSLRHPEALTSIRQLCSELFYTSSPCSAGASTVDSVQQIQECYEAGAQFISTKDTKMARFIACLALQLPVYSGIQNTADAHNALKWGASALKVFPATEIPPERVKKMLQDLSPQLARVRVFVSGGVAIDSIPQYFAAGATDIMLGLDLKTLSMSNITDKLLLYDGVIEKCGG